MFFTALAVAGTLVSGAMSILGGKKQKQAAYANARALEEDAAALMSVYDSRASLMHQEAEDARLIGDINAKIAERDAVDVNQTAQFNARMHELDAKASVDSAVDAAEKEKVAENRLIGEQVSRFGASGVSMAGSPMAILTETTQTAEKNLRNIFKTGLVQASRSLSEARAEKITGAQKMRNLMTEAMITRLYSSIESQRMHSKADLERLVGQGEADRILREASLTRIQGKTAAKMGLISGIGSTALGLGQIGMQGGFKKMGTEKVEVPVG